MINKKSILYASLLLLLASISYFSCHLIPNLISRYHHQKKIFQLQKQLTAINNNSTALKNLYQKIKNTPNLVRLHINLKKQYSIAARTRQLLTLIRHDKLQLISLTPQNNSDLSLIQLRLKGHYQTAVKFLNNIIYQPPFAWIKTLTLSSPHLNEKLNLNLQVIFDHA